MAALQSWRRFWFEPQPTSTLALVRIATGVLSLLWAVFLLPDLKTFFSPDGVFPRQPGGQGSGVWGLLEMFPGEGALILTYVALLVGSVCLILGLGSRFAAVIVLLGLIAFSRRSPFVMNSGDTLLHVLALYLAFAPSGESLSLDRLRRVGRERFWEFPARAPWAMRLIQIQLSVVYLSTVWQKVRGTTWNDGTAVSYALRLDDLERFPLPDAITTNLTMSNLMTFGTLATELSLGVLVWNRTLRPYVLALGVGMHLSIDYSLRVGLFSYTMFALYLAFVYPDTASRLILALRDRLTGLRRSRTTATEPAVGGGVARIRGR